MSFLSALIYDKILSSTEEACLQEWRFDLLKSLNGDVLEIGSGTGSSLDLYPDNLESLVLSEPDIHMRRQMQKKITSTKQNIYVSSDSAENIDAKNESYDFVVTSLVCCSVTNIEVALLEIKRVLKPGGRLIFLEHVAAPVGTQRRFWQNLMTPFWRKIAGNCHLNRETESSILTAGFEILEIKRESMCKAMPLVRPTIRGIAIKQ